MAGNAVIGAVITITTNGSGAGAVTVSLPHAAQSSAIFFGREAAVTGVLIYGDLAAGNIVFGIATAAGAYPGGDGHVLKINGTYECQ